MRGEMVFLLFSDVPVLAAAVIAAAGYRRFERTLQYFCIFVIFSALIQLAALALSLRHTNNMPLLHIYTPLSVGLLTLFYQKLLKKVINPQILTTVAVLFILFSVINSGFIQNIFTFNSYSLTLASILLIIITIFTFIISLDKKNLNLVKEYNLNTIGWVNAGLLIYHTSTLLIFYFSNYLVKYYNFKINSYIWIMHSIVSMVMYCCFIIGLWKQLRAYR